MTPSRLAEGRDILRTGNGVPSGNATSNTSSAASAAAAAQAAAAQAAIAQRATDTLRRTAQALQNMKAVQAQARANALAGANNLGKNPWNTSQQLLDVHDGLIDDRLQGFAGGLIPDSGIASSGSANPVTTWTGAGTPSQTTDANGKTIVTIIQNSQQALLNWQTFNIGKNTTLAFDQKTNGGDNAGQWVAFNFIKDPNGYPSQILGSIKADGQVYVINQNGVIFGGSSQVNTHALVASALPISSGSSGLITTGLLNFSAGIKFLFDQSLDNLLSGSSGGVAVQQGAVLKSPTTADHVGGKIALIGPNVTNAGTISTEDGQTILAAGNQVGFNAHSSADPSLRGLDVFIGSGGGTAENSANAVIDAPRANVTLAGKNINQYGAIHSTTSVSLNGRIDLLANSDAITNVSTSGQPFLPYTTGLVTLGAGSVTEILPEAESAETRDTTQLALPSLINVQGSAIHLQADSWLVAPGARQSVATTLTTTARDGMNAELMAGISLNAGQWYVDKSSTTYLATFATAGGQIYLDPGATISAAGLTNISVPVTQNIISVQLRGAELANSPLQRMGVLRGTTVLVDARVSGTSSDGTPWQGTPLADVTGYINLIQRGVGQLSTNGGTVSFSAGESLILSQGSTVDVSGGWISYAGGQVQTTSLRSGGNLIDISKATPDLVYDGVPIGFTETHAKWGPATTKTYTSTLLAGGGSHYEAGYIQGGQGGSISIIAPAMALDGNLLGNTVIGPRQRSTPSFSNLSLAFKEQKKDSTGQYIWASPAMATAMDINLADPKDLSVEPRVVIQDSSQMERLTDVWLSANVFNGNGFGSVAIDNSDGDILLPGSTVIQGAAGGSLTLSAANIFLNGKVTMPGGNLSFTVFDYSPLLRATKPDTEPTPAVDSTRGLFLLGSSASLNTAGLIVDDRLGASAPETGSLITKGGSVTIKSFTADLQKGSVIDVSAGVGIASNGKQNYGNAGSITIEAGRDPKISALIGGKLSLGASLLGYGGLQDVSVPYLNGSLTISMARPGGSLSILAPLVQIGGSPTSDTDVLFVDSGFFNQGGFSSFTLKGLGKAVVDPLTGLGVTDTVTGEPLYVPAVTVAEGTYINPVPETHIAVGSAGSLTLQSMVLPEAVRAPTSLTLNALGVKDATKAVPLVARGDLLINKGATLDAGLNGSVSLSGNTVTMLGNAYAPGGSIAINGATKSNDLFINTVEAVPTVLIGSQSVLDASGSLLLIPDPRGYRTGSILAGGTITVIGNIVAAQGSTLNVSGASGVLDLPANYSGASTLRGGGITSLSVGATTVESNAGSITLTGGQELYSDARLIGVSGGASAQGGNLIVSSGYFPPPTIPIPVIPTPLSPTLVVTQSGLQIPNSYYASGGFAIGHPVPVSTPTLDANGNSINGIGHFAVESFTAGGFDTLTLKGSVLFKGEVSITAPRSLTVADGGVIFGDSAVSLSAPYIAIGSSIFQPPQTQQQYLTALNARKDSSQLYSPTYGAGRLTVSAKLIDIGNLSLRNMGAANFIADNGDIRGIGTLDVAGDINIRAGQIYPPTASSFTIAAYDHGGTEGTVTIAPSGQRHTPLSAGGQLNIFASVINQGGVLRAPLGTINLGWNGIDAVPMDNVTGLAGDLITGAAFGATRQLTLSAGSVTSVSAIDAITGKALTIPYGVIVNDSQWIDPTGTDISSVGPPQKSVRLSAVNIDDQPGAGIDLRGGGDLYAYSFVTGTGGTKDVLFSTTSFAILPGYDTGYAALSPYNSNPSTTYLNYDAGYTPRVDPIQTVTDAGYVNASLKVGDRVYLKASRGLPAGFYTLLPARYALLDGGFLVTPKTGTPPESISLPDGSSRVSGYIQNIPASTAIAPGLYSQFEVASSAIVRARSQYSNYSANVFFTETANASGSVAPRLPMDAGQLVLSAMQSLKFEGSVASAAASGGRGSLVDISNPGNILIAVPGTSVPSGTLFLSTNTLNAIGADSLLIGGYRTTVSNSTSVTVTTQQLTVSNQGSPLIGTDIILVANSNLILSPNAAIEQAGTLSSSAQSLTLGGNGALVRVTADASAQISRSSISPSSAASLTVGAGTIVSGVGVTLDSTYATSLDPNALLSSNALYLNSGQISLQFAGQGPLDLKYTGTSQTKGLVLSGQALSTVMASSKSLSLLSYSSIDLYGTGQVGNAAFESLTLHAAEIRGFNAGDVTFTAKNIVLDNLTNAVAPIAVNNQSTTLAGSLTFEAGTIQSGNNNLNIDLYAKVALNATTALVAKNTGTLHTQGDLSITTPLITGASAANLIVKADGALNIQAPASGSGDTSLAGLGATLVLQGSSVIADSKILLPSGVLTLHATSGDVEIGGMLDVGGTEQRFFDLIKYTNGGQITLTSDRKNVILDEGSSVSVAAPAGIGDAGSLIISATNGTFTTGTLAASSVLSGSGGTGGMNGTFSLDVKNLANTALRGAKIFSSTALLDSELNAAGFTQSRKYRVRTGDVLIDGSATARSYSLSADQGSIIVSGTGKSTGQGYLDASGSRGGNIVLAAHGSVILEDGSVLTVNGQDFDAAGKGGSVSLEAGASTLDTTTGNYTPDTSALVDIQTGSTIDLSVASNVDLAHSSGTNPASASLGKFTGILHLRAPQKEIASGTQTLLDLQVNPINGNIMGASNIIVEGYKVYQPTGGSIDSVMPSVYDNGNKFVGTSGSKALGYDTMFGRLVNTNPDAALRSLVSIRPGAEIINTNGSTSTLSLQLNSVNSTLAVPTETTVVFPSGTPIGDTITTNVNGIITRQDGTTVAINSGTATTLAVGSSIRFANSVGSGIITFKAGSTPIPVTLSASSDYSTTGSTTVTPVGTINTIQLGSASSTLLLAAGVTVTFPNGIPGNDTIRTSGTATITYTSGSSVKIAPNISITTATLPVDSKLSLSGSGTITYFSGSTGGAIPITLPSAGTFTLNGAANISTNVGDLTLGTATAQTSTASVAAASDWNLSTYRFGPNKAPGVLTMRAAGNLRFYNALSDGFASCDYTAQLSPMNPLLPANSQSWSYRLVSGADFSAADFHNVQPFSPDLNANSGSLLLGRYGTGLAPNSGTAALTGSSVRGYYQVIRTGSGDIDIAAARSVKLLNQFATIYTAGTRIPTPTMVWSAGDFDLPIPNLLGSYLDPLGANQQPTPYAVQYSMAGGSVTIKAQQDILHQTLNGGKVEDDSEKQLPTNWLYRRGYVDPGTGMFGASKYGEIASTTWWVDFSNFFEGVGALGGGNVTLIAGNDVKNVDALIPTNARMPGYADSTRTTLANPKTSKPLELGGGDLVVRAGHDINGGVYYVERGNGDLNAGNRILTNGSRLPSYTASTLPVSSVDPLTSKSWLPTTFFLGKGNLDISAFSDVQMGPVVNPFLLPGGYNNTYWYKTYFSTYAPTDVVSVTSLAGNVTLQESTTLTSYSSTRVAMSWVPMLQAWADSVLRLTTNPLSTSYYQPWLRLDEASVTSFTTAFSLMPGALQTTAFTGDINLVGRINLSPSPTGTLDLIAAGSVNGLNVNGVTVVNNIPVSNWAAGTINLSDADPNALPGVASPYAYQMLVGTSPSARSTLGKFLDNVLDAFFAETGSTLGSQGSLQTRQTLHAPGVLHANDPFPARVYADEGDISSLTVYSSKATQIIAGNDITDIAFYLQNTKSGDNSIVSAGRDIIAFDSFSPTRNTISTNVASNQLNVTDAYPLPGDIQITGPGALEVLSGRNLDLGSVNANRYAPGDIGLGLTSIGNARNPSLGFEGADIIAAAGIGANFGLDHSSLDIQAFITRFLNPATSGVNAALYLPELRLSMESLLKADMSQSSTDQLWTSFQSLTQSQQEKLALQAFYAVLRTAGRTHLDASGPGYQAGYSAIASLFSAGQWSGDILLTQREIKTKNGVAYTGSNGKITYTGGNISLLAPGGKVAVGLDLSAGNALEKGIITEHGGGISSFSQQSVSLGSSRIFILRGGNIVIWSTLGNIAAGSSSKTVKSAPPTRVLFDPQSADVKTDLSGLATGGGIGVLDTVIGVAPGSVDLIAPVGNIDAGDAGIRATGNLYVAAVQILNASNIQTGGASVGTPVAPAAPNVGSMTANANTAGATMSNSESAASQARAQANASSQQEMPSIITVEVIGYGGGEGE